MRGVRGPVVSGLAVATVLGLSGCDAVEFSIPATPSPPPSASTSDAPSSDVLFTITATTTDAGGAPIELRLVAHEPQPLDAESGATLADSFIAGCSAVDAPFSQETLAANGSELMLIEVTSSAPGSALGDPIELQFGDPDAARLVTGDGLVNTDPYLCFGRYQLQSTGAATAIVNLDTGSPNPDPGQWRAGRYGFGALGTAQLSDCGIELSRLALDAHVDEVDGWSTRDHADGECAIGYRGE